MNILDEYIPKPQRELLEAWRVHVRQIGVTVGRKGMLDDEIVPMLLKLRRSTFFTRDVDFYKRHLSHARYSLVFLHVEKYETALFVKRFLRHPQFNTSAKRNGKVIRVSCRNLVLGYPWKKRTKV